MELKPTTQRASTLSTLHGRVGLSDPWRARVWALSESEADRRQAGSRAPRPNTPEVADREAAGASATAHDVADTLLHHPEVAAHLVHCQGRLNLPTAWLHAVDQSA